MSCEDSDLVVVPRMYYVEDELKECTFILFASKAKLTQVARRIVSDVEGIFLHKETRLWYAVRVGQKQKDIEEYVVSSILNKPHIYK